MLGEQVEISKDKIIDHKSPLPYYFQLKELLENEIKNGRLKPGQQIPSEFKLCERFRVSRTVVRQSISSLVQNGYLNREKGRGTFVTRPKIAENLFQNLTGLYEDMAARGIKPVTKVLEQTKWETNSEILKKLGLKPGESVIKIKRLRFINNEPFVLATTYLPYKICPSLLKEDLTNQSLYGVLEEKYALRIAYGRRSLEAVSADRHMATLLGVKVGTPLMLLNSISYLEDGRPIEYFQALHRGDRSRFVVALIRVRNHSKTSIDDSFISDLWDTGLVSL
ncbi:MAG: UTRA domain-containing protein [Clostridia bacterium]|nr:UTRA domain-containing protein [Clostridia bacterium]